MSGTTLSASIVYLKETPALIYQWEYSYDQGVTYYPINYNFPIYLLNPNAATGGTMYVQLMSNLIFYNQSYYFVFMNDNIVFDGKSLSSPYDGWWAFETSNVFGPPLSGAFQNGTESTTGASNIIIQNIQIFNTAGYPLQQNHGYLLQPYYGNGTSGCTVQNILINSNSSLTGQDTAGIGGAYTGYNSNNFTLNNCINKGLLTGQGTCGIVLNNAFNSATSTVITNCINYGNMSGANSCGLFGTGLGNSSNIISVSGCTNYGEADVTGASACTFFGPACFVGTSNASVVSCQNFSDIVAPNQGGLFGNGSFASCAGPVTVSQCMNFGRVGTNNISNCAGLFGSGCFASAAGGPVLIQNSFNTGDLFSANSCGILGPNAFGNCTVIDLTIVKCYNSGSIGSNIQTQYNMAGIVGSGSFLNWATPSAGSVTITNCYNDGPFQFSDVSAGIVGVGSFLTSSTRFPAPSVNITNCFNSSTLVNNSQAGIMVPYNPFLQYTSATMVAISISSCYSVYGQSTYAVNAIFLPYNQVAVNVFVFDTACNFTTLWDSQQAFFALINVASGVNGFNFYNPPSPYNLANSSYIDISEINSIEPVSQNIPFKIPFINNIYASPLNITAGDVIEPSTTQTFGVFRLVFSNTVFYQNLLLGTINSQTAYISTDFALQSESSALTITYQDGAIQNTSKTPPQTMQKTYSLAFFVLNIEAFCLLGDSLLETPTGYKMIKDFAPGDYVSTTEGPRKVCHLFKGSIVHKECTKERTKDRLYLLQAGSFPNLFADLVCSGGHPFLVENYGKEAKESHLQVWPNEAEHRLKGKLRFLTFLNPLSLIYPVYGVHDIYNVVLQSDDPAESFIIKVNGIETESLSQRFFDLSRKNVK